MSDTFYDVTSGFYDSVNSDRLYSADDMNKPYRDLLSEGVYGGSQDSANLKVIAGSGKSVTVKTGAALLNGRWVRAESNTSITLPSNTSGYSRIDSVFLRVNTAENTRRANLVLRTGDAAASPVHPAIVSTSTIKELRLADIEVANNFASVSSSNITDTRGGSDCPFIALQASATGGATYTAGEGISIVNNVISVSYGNGDAIQF